MKGGYSIGKSITDLVVACPKIIVLRWVFANIFNQFSSVEFACEARRGY